MASGPVPEPQDPENGKNSSWLSGCPETGAGRGHGGDNPARDDDGPVTKLTMMAMKTAVTEALTAVTVTNLVVTLHTPDKGPRLAEELRGRRLLPSLGRAASAESSGHPAPAVPAPGLDQGLGCKAWGLCSCSPIASDRGTAEHAGKS